MLENLDKGVNITLHRDFPAGGHRTSVKVGPGALLRVEDELKLVFWKRPSDWVPIVSSLGHVFMLIRHESIIHDKEGWWVLWQGQTVWAHTYVIENHSSLLIP